MELRILGPLDAIVGGRRVNLGGQRQQIILAMLALEANRVVSVDRLVDAVWDEDPPATAKGQIQICVSALRRAFEKAGASGVISTRPPGYVLHVTKGELDAQIFQDATASARGLTDDGNLGGAADILGSALAMWRGPALAGLSAAVVRIGATQLDERRQSTLEEKVRIELELGRHSELVAELFAAVRDQPLRERLHAYLMIALCRCGRKAEALEVYRRARTVLVEDLGIEPGEELRRLEYAILAGDPGLDSSTVVHERSNRPVPSQLPSDIADFTGREATIAEIEQVMLREHRAVPVVAIAGEGGVGKSVLAVHVAHRVRTAYPDGQLYARGRIGDALVSPAEILARFLRALGVAGNAIPESLDERAQMYRSRLADRRVLVVLDDVESEQQLIPILPGSPTCAAIATSRVRLSGLAGAWHFHVDVLDDDGAVELLSKVSGPARVQAEAEAAIALAKLCDRLPLALRIAGARLASRPHWRLHQLVERLRDQTHRLDELVHGDLGIRASIAMSYDGLAVESRRLLRRAALLEAPDFAAWAAAAVLGVGVSEAEDLLDRLVEAQLLTVVAQGRTGDVRYGFHELIRVFGRERAAVEDTADDLSEAVGRAICGWMGLAEEAHRREYGGDFTVLHGDAPRWTLPANVVDRLLANPMSWFEAERAALVAAVGQAALLGMHEACWDLALTSLTLFEARGYFDDWRETTQLALGACRQFENRRGIAAMLYSLGSLHVFEQQLDSAVEAFDPALSMFEELGDPHGTGLVLRHLAFVDRMQGRPEQARERYHLSLERLRAVGDHIGVAHVLCHLAGIHLDDEAFTLLGEALEICRNVGSRRVEAQVHHRLGEVCAQRGELAAATRSYQTVLRIVRASADRIGEAYALLGLGNVWQLEGRFSQAKAILQQALQIAEGSGERLAEARILHALGDLHVCLLDCEAARSCLDTAYGIFTEMKAAAWQAKTLASQQTLATLCED